MMMTMAFAVCYCHDVVLLLSWYTRGTDEDDGDFSSSCGAQEEGQTETLGKPPFGSQWRQSITTGATKDDQ